MKQSFGYLLYINLLNHLNDLKKYVVVVIIMVIMMALVLLGQDAMDSGENERGISIGLMMEIDGIYGNMLRSGFFNEEDYGDFVSVDTIEEGDDTSVYDTTVKIPNNFFEALMYFEYAPVDVSIKSTSVVKNFLVYEMVQSYNTYIKSVEASVTSLYRQMKTAGYEESVLYKYNKLLAFELIQMALKRSEFSAISIVGFFADVSPLDYYYSALIVMMMWLMSLVVGIKWLDTDHCSVLRRYLVSGRSVAIYIIAYVLVASLMIFTLGLTILIFSNSLGFIQVSRFSSHGLVILVMALFFTTLTLFFSNIFTNKGTMTTVSVVITLIASIAGGAVIPIFEMSSSMLSMARVTPNYWMIRALVTSIKGDGTSELSLMLGFSLILCVGLVLATTKMVVLNWKRGRL